jgi:hypothetical protein
MSLDAVNNFVKVTASAQASGDTTVTLSASDYAKLPAFPFNLIWYNSTDFPDPADDPNVEVVRATAGNGSTFVVTITRAQEGTSAANHNTAGKIYKMSQDITQAMIAQIAALVVGLRTSVAAFTTVGGDTSFTITPPTGTVNSILFMSIASQSFTPGSDVTLSGNNANLASAYSGPSGAPVVIVFNY